MRTNIVLDEFVVEIIFVPSAHISSTDPLFSDYTTIWLSCKLNPPFFTLILPFGYCLVPPDRYPSETVPQPWSFTSSSNPPTSGSEFSESDHTPISVSPDTPTSPSPTSLFSTRGSDFGPACRCASSRLRLLFKYLLCPYWLPIFIVL